MRLQKQIEAKIKTEFDPVYMELVNESSKHAHGSEESHFKLLVVSEKFVGVSRIARQRWIYQLLNEEMSQGIHALAQKALTPEEWEKLHLEFKTPDCSG